MTTDRTRLALPFAIFIAILATSTASIFIRFALDEGAPAIVIAALRLTIATVLLAPVALTKRLDEIRNLTRVEIALGALAGLFLAVHFAAWISSLAFTSVASSAVFVSTGPLWVALFSPALLNEKISRTAIAGLALAFLGGTIIAVSDACVWNGGLSCAPLQDVLQSRAMWGNLLALTGALAVSGYLIVGRSLRKKMPLIPYIFLVYAAAAVALTIMMFASGHTPFGYSSKAYLWIFLLAFVPQLIGHSTFNWLLKYLPATFVAVTTLTEPIASSILAYFLLRETPTIFIFFGGCALLIGVYFASKDNDTSDKEPM